MSEPEDLREMELALGEIPPEAFLEGPPPGGDLLLRRTLDEVRRESRRETWRNRSLLAAAAALVVVLALGGGAWAGRQTDPPASDTTGAVRAATMTEAATGVTMAAEVRPATGWVRLHVTVTGAPPGEQCRLVVVAPDGTREQAGSWLASESGRTTVDGAALMAPADVAAVQAETYAGQILVRVPV
jgi:hypothetical protein